MKKFATLICALVLVAAACGGDDDDGAVDVDDSPLAAAIADDVMSEDGAPVTDRAEAECFAGNVVGRIGEDRLGELGVTVDSVGDIPDIDFTDDELNTLLDSLTDCVDLEAAMAEEFAEDFGAEAAECLASELGEDTLVDLMRQGFTDPDAEPTAEFFNTFLDAAAECDLQLN